MRIRSIKPQFWINEKLGTVSREARLLYIGLWNLSDDRGVFECRPLRIKAQLYPYDEDINSDDVSGWLKELNDINKIVIFKESTNYYGYIPTFLEHQEIKKPSQWTFSKKLPDESSIIKELPTSTPLVTHQLDTASVGVPLGSRGVGSREKVIGSPINRGAEKEQKTEEPTPEGVLLNAKNKKQPNPLIKEIYLEMQKYLGYPDKIQKDPIPTYPKEGSALQRMFNRGYTKEEILTCWKKKVDFTKGFVSMTWVNQDIGNNGFHESKQGYTKPNSLKITTPYSESEQKQIDEIISRSQN
jgi:hypothetical protein